jgi:hypothetical protein
MEGEAIELNDQSLLWPERIDLEIVDEDVRRRRRKVVFAAKDREAFLQRRAGRERCSGFGDQPMAGSHPTPAHPTGTGGFHCAEFEEAKPIRLFECPLQPGAIDHGGEVNECSGHRGSWDCVDDGAVVCVETPPVQSNSPTTRSAARGRYVHGR